MGLSVCITFIVVTLPHPNRVSSIMPTSSTKNSQHLRSRFARNAIPTEEDFADLIAGSLHQAEDGVLKVEDQSLGLVRQTANAPLLQFFSEPAAAESAWQAQLIGPVKPGLGLSGPAGFPSLFLDGPTGNVGIGTAVASHRLTIEGPWPDRQAPGSKLSKQGALAIRSHPPQLDFLAEEATAKDWAIQVRNNKLMFIRSPWETSDLVLDGAGNVGIGTENPSHKLHVAGKLQVDGDLAVQGRLAITGRVNSSGGQTRSNLWYISKNGTDSGSDQGFGRLNTRSLHVNKQHPDTVLRILYSDTASISGGTVAAQWEIRINGNPLQEPIIMGHHYQSHLDGVHTRVAIVGYTNPLPPGPYEIQVWIRRAPGYTQPSYIATGFKSSTWCLEAEEVRRNVINTRSSPSSSPR